MTTFVNKSHLETSWQTIERKTDTYTFGNTATLIKHYFFLLWRVQNKIRNALWLFKAFRILTGIVCLADLEQAVSLSPAPSPPAFGFSHLVFPALETPITASSPNEEVWVYNFIWENHTYRWNCLRLLPEPRRWGRGRAGAWMMAAPESVPWKFQEEQIEIQGNTAAEYPASIPRLAQCLAWVPQVAALVSSLSQAASLLRCSPLLACASAQTSPGKPSKSSNDPEIHLEWHSISS